jgi:hypothetical protein
VLKVFKNREGNGLAAVVKFIGKQTVGIGGGWKWFGVVSSTVLKMEIQKCRYAS